MKHYRKLLGIASLSFTLVSSGMAIADPQVTTKGGVEIGDQNNDDFWFGVSGGLKLDQTFFTGNTQSKGTEFKSGGNIRSGWVDFDGGIGKNITYSMDLGIGSDAKIKLNDAYFTYAGWSENTSISLGQISPGSCLQNTTSSKWTPFLERSLDAAAFGLDTGLGFNISKWSNKYSFILNAIQPGYGEKPKAPGVRDSKDEDTKISRSDRWVIASRVTYNPFINLEEHKIFQIGGSASYEDNSNAGITYSTQPEARARDTGYALTTDKASNLVANAKKYISAKHNETYVAEVSGQNGSFTAEAEYQIAKVKRSTNAGANLKFTGWHVQAAYVLTGEARTYKQNNGTFTQVIPQAESGAWEVAARYSTVNLNSKDIRGGVGKNATLGLNYYANKNVRVAANYINSKTTKDAGNRKLNIFGMRLQLVF
eukprot:TRINITY_DN13344_c0_g2_i2.p1 TRINITY_DN13344_c0_g2~~TRINITY_DN13344_c0_g2_i2.p1  ORF type:complete len:425 (-),score=-6.33 TRINITY_DN13344_c0_g2_i2:72-1346(-)